MNGARTGFSRSCGVPSLLFLQCVNMISGGSSFPGSAASSSGGKWTSSEISRSVFAESGAVSSAAWRISPLTTTLFFSASAAILKLSHGAGTGKVFISEKFEAERPAFYRVSRTDRHDIQFERQNGTVEIDRIQESVECFNPLGWHPYRKRATPAENLESLDQLRESARMVRMQVGDCQCADQVRRDSEADQRRAHGFPAVDQQCVGVRFHKNGGVETAKRGNSCGGAEKADLHGRTS